MHACTHAPLHSTYTRSPAPSLCPLPLPLLLPSSFHPFHTPPPTSSITTRPLHILTDLTATHLGLLLSRRLDSRSHQIPPPTRTNATGLDRRVYPGHHLRRPYARSSYPTTRIWTTLLLHKKPGGSACEFEFRTGLPPFPWRGALAGAHSGKDQTLKTHWLDTLTFASRHLITRHSRSHI
ncbi:uncharacterized protein B0I36DRAFT_129428 [Microdochium trichocladiopsis]|uniref:Uncharacterized protein n=1 Tax=Microdochium trichocladiopsis TaxID=1682393 RepID=A0A9P8Y433_9PEZI|nr:uncharacterized protein B0I36DRAFT_129428 [Microdochium trichocladiopsis]KAH7029207.1 hypothetical protein B0I36DRAFT_129428 [Microdochium trichocladiopsis]